MKIVLVSLLTVFASVSYGAGTWSCEGGQVKVEGTYSDAGYAVTGFTYAGQALDYATSGLYADGSSLMIELKDSVLDQTLLTIRAFVTTPTEGDIKATQAEWVAGGLMTVMVDTPTNNTIYCTGAN